MIRLRPPATVLAGGRFGLSKKLKTSPSADMRRRRRHRQGNFAANCVRGALATSARFAVKFCRRGFQRAAEPSTACGGYSEAEQGQRSQSASAIYGAPRDAGTATRRNSRVRQLPCAAVAPFAACRVSRHAVTSPGRHSCRGAFCVVRAKFYKLSTIPARRRKKCVPPRTGGPTPP